MMYPTAFSYWEKPKAFIDYEPVECMSPEARGVLASVGIIKGVPFKPDAATKEALTRAVEDAPKLIFADRVAGRSDRKELYYSDRQYVSIWPDASADFHTPTYRDVDMMAAIDRQHSKIVPSDGAAGSFGMGMSRVGTGGCGRGRGGGKPPGRSYRLESRAAARLVSSTAWATVTGS
jgi:hypothetical protein